MNAPSDAPLAGVRVVDLTMAWAGPMAVRVLAELGADVVKIEAAGKMDRWRGGTFVQRGTERYPDGDAGERPWNRNAYFNTQNVNKRGIALDLKSDEGRNIFLRLVETADVVAENFAFGAMGRLGLEYDTLVRHRPGLVMLSMPGFGSQGPERGYVAHGPTIEELAGNAFLQGYPDGPPLASGRLAWGDPVAGMTAAALTLFAVWRQRLTGEGGHFDLSQIEAGVLFNFDSILGAIERDETPARLGAGHAYLSPHGAYKCAGEDRWISLACRDECDWQGICEVVGSDVLSKDTSLLDVETRRKCAALVDAEIGAWAQHLDPHEAANRLRAHGVPAGPLLNAAEVLDDEQMRHRGYFTQITHPEAGTHRYAGLPWTYGSQPSWWRSTRPAPCFGEHNEAVLAELGFDKAEIERLTQAGVLAKEPIRQGD